MEFYIFIGAVKGIVKEDQRFMNKDLALEAFKTYTGHTFDEFLENPDLFKRTDLEGTNIYVGDLDKLTENFEKADGWSESEVDG